MGKDRTGADGADVELALPLGTQIFAEDGETLIADLARPEQTAVLARGGAGGLGNTRFTSINRAPRQAPWRARRGALAVAAPEAARRRRAPWPPNRQVDLSRRRIARAPKIADYPFTTLEPKLGTVTIDHESFVIADIPGLIEGAHEGAGLGDRFLGHIERCRVLIHLVDGTQADVAGAYRTVRRELAAYEPELTRRPELVCLNKVDALRARRIAAKAAALRAAAHRPVFPTSGVARRGLEEVLRAAHAEIRNARGGASVSTRRW